MQSTISKILALILVPLFLITGVVSIPDYAWCIGDDDHLEIERFEIGGCVDEGLNDRDSNGHDSVSVNEFGEDHCGPCVDFYIPSNDVITLKQLKSFSPAYLDTFSTGSVTPHSFQVAKMVVGNLVPQPPPRISSQVLTHRTVVLLV